MDNKSNIKEKAFENQSELNLKSEVATGTSPCTKCGQVHIGECPID